jgi:hypothetical protein
MSSISGVTERGWRTVELTATLDASAAETLG